jgi:hypothetical protein
VILEIDLREFNLKLPLVSVVVLISSTCSAICA